MEAEGFSETLVRMYHTTWHDIPEDCSLHSHRHENLKSNDVSFNYVLQPTM